MNEKLGRSEAPSSVIVARLYSECVFSRWKIGVSDTSLRDSLSGRNPVIIKSFQLVGEKITSSGKIIDNGKADTERLPVGGERHPQQFSVASLEVFGYTVPDIRYRLVLDGRSGNDGVRRIGVIDKLIGVEISDTFQTSQINNTVFGLARSVCIELVVAESVLDAIIEESLFRRVKAG